MKYFRFRPFPKSDKPLPASGIKNNDMIRNCSSPAYKTLLLQGLPDFYSQFHSRALKWLISGPHPGMNWISCCKVIIFKQGPGPPRRSRKNLNSENLERKTPLTGVCVIPGGLTCAGPGEKTASTRGAKVPKIRLFVSPPWREGKSAAEDLRRYRL